MTRLNKKQLKKSTMELDMTFLGMIAEVRATSMEDETKTYIIEMLEDQLKVEKHTLMCLNGVYLVDED